MFLILNAPRCGSELLADALSNHLDLKVKSEILNPHRYVEWRNQILIDTNMGILNYTSHIDKEIPISTAIFNQTTKLVDFVKEAFKKLDGFKVTYDQITPESPVVEYLKELKQLKIIFIQRNYLESAISYWFAIKSQIWQINNHDKPIYDASQVVDPKFVDNFCESALKYDAIYRSIFREHPQLVVNYKDLVTNFLQTIDSVQEFLGVRNLMPKVSFRKRLSRPLPELVINYQELLKSPWANIPCLS